MIKVQQLIPVLVVASFLTACNVSKIDLYNANELYDCNKWSQYGEVTLRDDFIGSGYSLVRKYENKEACEASNDFANYIRKENPSHPDLKPVRVVSPKEHNEKLDLRDKVRGSVLHSRGMPYVEGNPMASPPGLNRPSN